MTTSLYSLRSTPAPGEFSIMKFDEDYTVESVYALNATTCTCPQGHKPKCKHRRMLPLFQAAGHVDDGWFLDWTTRLWHHPLADAAAPAPLADPALMGDAEHAEEIARRLAPALATEGSNLVLSHEGDAPGPSTLAVETVASASANGRGQPSPVAPSTKGEGATAPPAGPSTDCEPKAMATVPSATTPPTPSAPAPGEIKRRRF